MTPRQAYEEIVRREQERWTLSSVNRLLEWDQETYMPVGGTEHRANQMGLLARLTHEQQTDPRLGELLAVCENSELTSDPFSDTGSNLRQWRRAYDRATKLPTDLVEEMTRLASRGQRVWGEARRTNDFALFAPLLEQMLELQLRAAECYGYAGEAYDALIEGFEPGSTAAEIETIFAGLRKDLVPLVARIAAAASKPDIGLIKRPYPVDRQQLFAETVAAAFGYDFTAGRLDEVTHPFCMGVGPGDVRICTRYYPNDFAEGLTGVTHEAGHGLYEAGLLPEHYGTPRADSVSSGIHESQSRLWENQVGRSRAFWRYFFPQAKRIFRDSLKGIEEEDLYRAFNFVAPSYIRVEADEATYNLHIMLRFEMERALIRRELAVKDIPGEWNKRFKTYLGIEVDKDSNGCLQDVHWSAGLFGYFPSYALGNLYAAQFYGKAREEMPDMDDRFSRGDFSGLLAWLRENIHHQGQRYTAKQLCEQVTGKPLSHQPLIDYLYEKYRLIYGIAR